MTWNPIWPQGATSVSQNTLPGQQNTAYTETTMNNDHYWNIGVDENGHHKWVQTVATNDANKSLATNATLATGMDLVYFSRFKTPTEATTTGAQNSQPFAVSQDAAVIPNVSILQLLGIRAMAVFNNVGTISYAFNIASVSNTATGKYTATYTNALPTNTYAVLGGGMQSSASGRPCFFSVRGAASITTSLSTTLVKFDFWNDASTLVAPSQGWFICFGG